MELNELRNEIDKIDDEISRLFTERMKISEQVAEYKRKNKMEVLQSGRETQILDRVSAGAPDYLGNAQRLLFRTIMDISKCRQTDLLSSLPPYKAALQKENPIVACPGIEGSYSEAACKKAFAKMQQIRYYATFDKVFEAVDSGLCDYGVLPLENSTAGDVSVTYDLMGKYDFYITKRVSVKVEHVLAAKNAADKNAVSEILSHEQALHQCSDFLRESAIKSTPVANTSIAAKAVSDSAEPIACICSRSCAELYGLNVIEENIADSKENFTRFIVISKSLEISENADMISISLSLPHTAGSLFRMLTKFAYNGLNLTKIESKPLPTSFSSNMREEIFDVIFYFDIAGSVRDEGVARLLLSLKNEMKYYKFLGNYEEML